MGMGMVGLVQLSLMDGKERGGKGGFGALIERGGWVMMPCRYYA